MINSKLITIFREKSTSALTDFDAGPLSWLNWILEILVFVELGKSSEQGETNKNKLKRKPHMAPG